MNNEQTTTYEMLDNSISQKSWIVALLTCFFLGYLGIHRFYAGKIFTGILQLITGGGFGIWWVIDCVRILIGRFSDSEGKKIKN